MSTATAILESTRTGQPVTLAWSEALSDAIVCDSWEAFGLHDAAFYGNHEGVCSFTWLWWLKSPCNQLLIR